MGDENPIRTLGDYSKPNHEGYMNTIELPVENNVVPLRSDTIRLVQNGCSFYGLRSEDRNQHLKDFLKLVDLLNLDGENRERTRLRLFQFSLRDQASNWLKRLPAGSITTWEDPVTRMRYETVYLHDHMKEQLSVKELIDMEPEPNQDVKPVITQGEDQVVAAGMASEHMVYERDKKGELFVITLEDIEITDIVYD
ncbi:hypothetical protein Tco_0704813 [Tanacetum coccineum]|uniref:MAK10-like protein n=1 Tax=Tanacetum coccineum TaxID=301880 RepID=A0ABQ4Y3K5_9ASTR